MSNSVQSAVAVEYTDCRKVRLRPKEYPGHDNNVMVSFWECRAPLHCHRSRVHHEPE